MNASYVADLKQFQAQPIDEVIGALASAAARRGYAQHWHSQTAAWLEQLRILQSVSAGVIRRRDSASAWSILLEYEIPRREKRIDAIVLASGTIAVLEFKVGATAFDAASVWQVREYALDLRDFHTGSRGRPMVPVLVATEACHTKMAEELYAGDARSSLVWPVVRASPDGLAEILLNAAGISDRLDLLPIEATEWCESPYRPALSIIESAAAIFAGHQVREIAHASADDLAATANAVVEVVRRAHAEGKRVACFVTGVPGAGKTLTGLAAVHDPELRREGAAAAVFLSGNGPLVRIVRTALARDVSKRGKGTRESNRQVSTFIQNVHEFLGEYGIKHQHHTPPERVVVFDEAQRAWNADQMERKRGISISEPAMMLDVMERCAQCCVVVALIGGGQEIHNGEAGLAEWGRALSAREAAWEIVAPPEALFGGASLAGQRLFEPGGADAIAVKTDARLHLNTNIRSFRAQVVGEWVNAVLAGDADRARGLLSGVDEYPVAMTRDLSVARAWLKSHAGGEQRPGAAGLVASSGALRLRSYGLEVSSGFRRSFPFEDWFLANGNDVRSSNRLEVAATEFECQGLELDWVGVCWGDDVTFDARSGQWQLRRFVGSRWAAIHNSAVRQYLLNKYRVLLTRARRGMIIWLPEGSAEDPTRDPYRLEQTLDFLCACGLRIHRGDPLEGVYPSAAE